MLDLGQGLGQVGVNLPDSFEDCPNTNEKTNFDTLKITQTGNSVADEANSIQADLDVSAVKLALSYRF